MEIQFAVQTLHSYTEALWNKVFHWTGDILGDFRFIFDYFDTWAWQFSKLENENFEKNFWWKSGRCMMWARVYSWKHGLDRSESELSVIVKLLK